MSSHENDPRNPKLMPGTGLIVDMVNSIHLQKAAILKVLDDKKFEQEFRERYLLLKDMRSPKEEYLAFDPHKQISLMMSHSAVKSMFGTDRRSFERFMEDRLKHVKLVYDPTRNAKPFTTEQLTGVKLYNTYTPPDWREEEYRSTTWAQARTLPAPPPLMERFLRHITNNHEPSYNYLLDWMSYSLYKRNRTILVAIGEQGVGKGILGAILCGMHGESNSVEVTDGVFKNKFNGQLGDKTLVYVDEIDLQTQEQIDRVKTVVNDKMTVEKKGMDAETKVNYANFYFSSNHVDAIKVTRDDRRYSIIELTKVPARQVFSSAELNMLGSNKTLHNDFARYLITRKQPQNWELNPFTNSTTFEEVKDASIPEWERYMTEIWAHKFAGKECSYKDVVLDLKENMSIRYTVGRRKFEGLVKKYPEVFGLIKRGNEWVITSKLEKQSSKAIQKLTENKGD